MRKVLTYYFIPIVIFILLAFLGIKDTSPKGVFMTIISSVILGLFAGFIFHMATIVKKKLS